MWLTGNREAVGTLSQRDSDQLFSSHSPQHEENIPGLSLFPIGSVLTPLHPDAEGDNPSRWCSASPQSKMQPAPRNVETPTPSALETSVVPRQASAVLNARRKMYPVSPGCGSVPSSTAYGGSKIGEKASIVRACNLELAKAHLLSRSQVSLDDQTNQDALIHAVLQGWDMVERRGNFCPLWGILRFFDNNIFWVANTTTRLVMLRMIHYMLLCQVKAESFNELPSWYRPRPVQYRFPHDTIMSYFAWPGLRERLVLASEPMLNDAFCDTFARSFRFHWPADLGDMYLTNPQTGLLQFSGTFTNHLHEIGRWRMDTAFFDAYPETYDDITPTESATQIVNVGALHSRLSIEQRAASEVEFGDYHHLLREDDDDSPEDLVCTHDPWSLVWADLHSGTGSHPAFDDCCKFQFPNE